MIAGLKKDEFAKLIYAHQVDGGWAKSPEHDPSCHTTADALNVLSRAQEVVDVKALLAARKFTQEKWDEISEERSPFIQDIVGVARTEMNIVNSAPEGPTVSHAARRVRDSSVDMLVGAFMPEEGGWPKRVGGKTPSIHATYFATWTLDKAAAQALREEGGSARSKKLRKMAIRGREYILGREFEDSGEWASSVSPDGRPRPAETDNDTVTTILATIALANCQCAHEPCECKFGRSARRGADWLVNNPERWMTSQKQWLRYDAFDHDDGFIPACVLAPLAIVCAYSTALDPSDPQHEETPGATRALEQIDRALPVLMNMEVAGTRDAMPGLSEFGGSPMIGTTRSYLSLLKRLREAGLNPRQRTNDTLDDLNYRLDSLRSNAVSRLSLLTIHQQRESTFSHAVLSGNLPDPARRERPLSFSVRNLRGEGVAVLAAIRVASAEPLGTASHEEWVPFESVRSAYASLTGKQMTEIGETLRRSVTRVNEQLLGLIAKELGLELDTKAYKVAEVSEDNGDYFACCLWKTDVVLVRSSTVSAP